MLAHQLDHLVPAADLGHDLQVGLQGEQRGQRAADQRLVIGEQQADRGGHGVIMTRGPAARSRPRRAVRR